MNINRTQSALAVALTVLLGLSGVMAQSIEQVPQVESEMMQVAELVPGFGGLYYDEQGRPNVYLLDRSQEARLKAVNPDIVIHQADYDFATLRTYRIGLREALSLEGVVALDVDERSNRIRVSINQEAHPRIKAVLRRQIRALADDENAVIIDEVPEIVRHVSLRDSVRPIPGGVEIGFPGFLCTLGYNVNGATEFITNSHCTSVQGGTEGTPYTQDAGGGSIGVELFDPVYNVTPCPFGRVCRRSDSARVRYNSSGLGNQGRIARTVTCNGGGANDREINGNLTINGVGSASTGQTVTKVGRTTGCRRGTVAQTCADVNVGGTNITQLCQTIVVASGPAMSLGGDSGSPVFIQNGNNATAVGLLWGGNGSGSVMVFSPIDQVLDELF
ncbi:MAG TPA: S1 family peptidase [Acidobacteriota bacterium]|nr:S1 family peptidase [Acidobacteriota bacterium]